ncbi:MAG TPA: OmpA family protein, partial [Polyangiaceae bacterium]
GIADGADACPKEPGTAAADPRKNGCPQLVTVETMGIVILQQVLFTRGASTVLAESLPVIDATVSALRRTPVPHPIEIAGHASADEPGAQRLSEARAKAVMARMVAAGVDAKRLVVRGYGASKPIDDNKTSDGRQKNRRVEFHLLEDVQASTGGGASCAPTPAAAGRP